MSVCMSMPIYSTNIYTYICVYVYIYIGTHIVVKYMHICIHICTQILSMYKNSGYKSFVICMCCNSFSQALACFFTLLALCFEEHK